MKQVRTMNAVLCWHRLFGWPVLRELDRRLQYAANWPAPRSDWWWRG